ncbi:hypothetical protein [Haloarcula japonica]|uniref:Envelope protein N-terminal domain-containing protein n=1 Tax=Haloarcula japonica (strain ATCC 49778 / DSM 6131 / JCM 7785 / NBRC 101032 / NCIMB 13157 / TR-1) TaxID=1227453 RepID=M0LLI3_HALJT|nr:hypothetical protein [Haloarcula japonica]EMA34381.1 hypothetical protein C444_02561 [Haloarcula japonica DSM 6131]
MTRVRSVLLTALIVCSAVFGAAGPALAQSTETTTDSGPVTKTFETGPHKVKIDLFEVSSETTITVITDESPAGDNTAILRKTVSGSQNSAHFRNAGAYEKFTIRVEDADGPVSFSKGGVTNAWTPGDDGKFLGDTGGDPGFTYDLKEQIGESVMPQVVQLDRTGLPGSTTVNTTGTDASQTKLDIYQSALNTRASAENYGASLDNNLQNSKTQARVLGKNAYIRALNNGSSKATAKTEAKEAVDKFYAAKQRNLLAEWNREQANVEYLNSVAANESGINGLGTRSLNGGPGYINSIDIHTRNGGSYVYEMLFSGWKTNTVTLVNGDTVEVKQVQYEYLYSDGGYSTEKTGITAGPTVGQASSYGGWTGESGYLKEISAITIKGHDSNAEPIKVLNSTKYTNRYNAIDSQAQTVRNDMDTLAENTYSAYQKGEINSSNLVDPYVLASQQSAGDDFQGWAAAQLTVLGTNSPENFDQIGRFEVSNDGSEYEGVLFSQENPASGQFEAGQTYDASTLGGTQYVVTSDRIVELNGEFTIGNITDTNGESVENVTIEKTTYQTTNVTELKQQYEDLAYKRAQIEAREQAMRSSAGGGFLGGGKVSPIIALAIIGSLLAVVVLQN